MGGPPRPSDRIRLRRWLAAYAVLLLLALALLAVLVAREPWHWAQWRGQFRPTFASAGPGVKLLAMGIYLSLCTTLLPLPTGWLIACVATREAAVASTAWGTVLAVGLVGAAASTVANLNEYHLLTWMLRHPRIAALRRSRLHGAGARWFARSPFLLVVAFNLLPIPLDVVRVLSATCRYPRGPFAAANLLGRFVRYAVIAFVTYWWDLGWAAAWVLLGLAVAVGLGRIGVSLFRRLLRTAGPAA